eukprot:TRINITY_DN1976_c0_g1_i1.p1 TRINITY_DN1976_c0_g1~~TRINITY_DN1976_c0_g1_i1.p1  ORF type:complete len:189 (+),score=49.09 TRINITY_DN1976_c0_g1_i1:212-778(+)
MNCQAALEDSINLHHAFINDVRSLLQSSPVAVLMRGVPGSGKSTIVSALTAAVPAGQAVVSSADHYFVNPETGVYEFDFTQLRPAHAACRETFEQACNSGVPLVLLDNTCVRAWEYQHYQEYAAATGYTIQVVELRSEADPDQLATALFGRNSHGVPLDKIQMMLQNWEEDTTSVLSLIHISEPTRPY